VKRSRARRLAASLAIVCGLMQPLFGSNALVGLASLLHGHGHEVTLEADSGHLDLVLSHGASNASDGLHAAERHLHTGPAPHGDHLVHLMSKDAVRDAVRRDAVDARVAVSLPLPPFASRPPVVASSYRFERFAVAKPVPKTVVLRI
jgi:hypothetical protein